MAGNDDAMLLDEAGRALFHLGRVLGRPGERQGTTDSAGRAVELSRIMVVQAVEATREAAPDAEIGVGAVAAHLAIDPSTASRLVAETVADGFLTSSPSPTDARRRRLDLTPAGLALAAAARRHQHATFARALRDWPPPSSGFSRGVSSSSPPRSSPHESKPGAIDGRSGRRKRTRLAADRPAMAPRRAARPARTRQRHQEWVSGGGDYSRSSPARGPAPRPDPR